MAIGDAMAISGDTMEMFPKFLVDGLQSIFEVGYFRFFSLGFPTKMFNLSSLNCFESLMKLCGILSYLLIYETLIIGSIVCFCLNEMFWLKLICLLFVLFHFLVILASLLFDSLMACHSITEGMVGCFQNIPIVRMFYQIISQPIYTNIPSDDMNLTDCQNVENLACYYFLEKKEKTIVVVDGENDEKYDHKNLFYLLDRARKILKCSFHINGKDVDRELFQTFRDNPVQHCGYLKIDVEYSNKNKGMIYYLKPKFGSKDSFYKMGKDITDSVCIDLSSKSLTLSECEKCGQNLKKTDELKE
jgi:hypothetical protein